MISLFQPSGSTPRQHDLAKLIDSCLSKTSASSLGIAGCNPSGPVSLPTPSRTALLLISLHLPQQQAQLAGQTACKNTPFGSSGQAFAFINPSVCNNRHHSCNSAATYSVLASNSPCKLQIHFLSIKHCAQNWPHPLALSPSKDPRGPGSRVSPARCSHSPSVSRHTHRLSRNSPALAGCHIDTHGVIKVGKVP